MKMWFKELTGFKEESPEQVRENLVLDGEVMTSRVNGRRMVHGRLETPRLVDLRTRLKANPPPLGNLKLSEVVCDVQDLHQQPSNFGALFQVASQFNLLEMVSPFKTPEDGVAIYEFDRTQGPACAIACGAGTIYRNYFAEVNGKIGQSADNQINCLGDLGNLLGNSDERLWVMRNGYALPSAAGLAEIYRRLSAMDEISRDTLRQVLRIGIQWNTQVTINGGSHLVTQAYCSALPVSYANHYGEHWGSFATLILEAAYEATLAAAYLNYTNTGNNKVFLTLLGGGAFGNLDEWVFPSIERALRKYASVNLEVVIVSYGSSNRLVRDLVTALSA